MINRAALEGQRQAMWADKPIGFGDARLPFRFWARVSVDQGGCWVWTGGKSDRGYGYFRHGGRVQRVHRLAFVALRGAIPEGLGLDHLCRNKLCIRPDHLEPVSGAVNTRRAADDRAAELLLVSKT